VQRRSFIRQALGSFATVGAAGLTTGCRSMQFSRIVKPGEDQMVGSHQAGQETFCPLVEESVAKLLARHVPPAVVQTSFEATDTLPPPVKRICFVAVENQSAEDIGDFKERLYEIIDSRILESQVFESINRRYVEAGLRDSRLRPDQLMVPENRRAFAALMEQQGQPVDYLLYATLTSGTTVENREYQRDYLLTLELVDVTSGKYDKQSAAISKGYHKSRLSRWQATNPLAPR
jgi:hypothetical protein